MSPKHSPRLIALAAALTPLAAQTPPSTSVRWFPAAETASKQAQSASPWVSLLDTTTLSTGRYRLAKGATDGQEPHARDEVCFVVAGKAKLEAGGETRAVGKGDTVFVAARVPHRFLDIEEDLDVLVFFSAARAPTGGMAGLPAPTEQTPYAETSQRGNTRIFYWYGPDSAGQVAIDFGQPRWQPAFADFMKQPSARRWRLGQNFWTTLDTNMPFVLGGADVPVGSYYLVLQNAPEQGMQLVLLDPRAVREQRLDAYEAAKTTGGIAVPLTAAKSGHPSPTLDVELTLDAGQRDRGLLSIRFGPHVLTAPLSMRPHRG
jgi:quercetin dioxygenase-like cupin family protein